MARRKHIFFILVLPILVWFSLAVAQEREKSESSAAKINPENYWGNQGLIYSKPELPAPPTKKTKTGTIKTAPKKPLAPKVKTTAPQTMKIQPPKPLKTQPPPVETTPEEPAYVQEPSEEPTQTPEIKEEPAAPGEEAAILKAKLEKALSQLALANQKIKALEETRGSSKKATPTYQVKKGDSLWSIAKKKEVYANPYKWLLIYHANRDLIYDPNLIFPYMVLFVPQFEEYENTTKK